MPLFDLLLIVGLEGPTGGEGSRYKHVSVPLSPASGKEKGVEPD